MTRDECGSADAPHSTSSACAGARWRRRGRAADCRLRTPAPAVLLSPFVRQRLRSLISTERQEDLLFLKDLIEAGKVRPVISRANPLSEERGCVSPQGLPEKVPGDGGGLSEAVGVRLAFSGSGVRRGTQGRAGSEAASRSTPFDRRGPADPRRSLPQRAGAGRR